MRLSYFLPAIESWSEWSAAFNDADLWKPVIDAICDDEGIHYRSIEIPRSNTNAVFILDRQLVVKIYSPFWSEFDMETTLTKVLEESETVPVPQIVAAGRFQDRVSWNYLIMEHCPGLTLDAIRPGITRGDTLSITAQVGRMVRGLHETPLTLFEDVNVGESWDDLVDRRRREVLPELTANGIITSEVADTLDAILEQATWAIPGAARASWFTGTWSQTTSCSERGERGVEDNRHHRFRGRQDRRERL